MHDYHNCTNFFLINDWNINSRWNCTLLLSNQCVYFQQKQGILGVTLTVSLPALKPPICNQISQVGHCNSSATLQLCVLYVSLGLLTIGAGAIQPWAYLLELDQFDQTDERSRKGLHCYYNRHLYSRSTAAPVLSMAVIYIQINISWACYTFP